MPAGVSAWTALANKTLTTTASSVVFSSISQSHRDLVLVVDGSLSAGLYTVVKAQFNSDTGYNYISTQIYSPTSGTTPASTMSSDNGWYLNGALGAGNSGQTSFVTNLIDYSTSNKYKLVMSQAVANGSSVNASVGQWASTSAITSITLTPSSGSFSSGTTFSLYGVSA